MLELNKDGRPTNPSTTTGGLIDLKGTNVLDEHKKIEKKGRDEIKQLLLR